MEALRKQNLHLQQMVDTMAKEKELLESGNSLKEKPLELVIADTGNFSKNGHHPS